MEFGFRTPCRMDTDKHQQVSLEHVLVPNIDDSQETFHISWGDSRYVVEHNRVLD